MNTQDHTTPAPDTHASSHTRWVYNSPTAPAETRGFASSFHSDMEDGNPEDDDDELIDFATQHQGTLALWAVHGHEDDRLGGLRPGHDPPTEPLVAFAYRVKVRRQQPLRAAEIRELAASVHEALDRIVDRRRSREDGSVLQGA